MSFKQEFVIGISLGWLLAGAIGFGQAAAPAQTGAPAALPQPRQRPPDVRSPEVTPDCRIIFRILAPEARTVTVAGPDFPGQVQKLLEFAKNDQGIWEATSEPVPAGAYRYYFKVDGVATIDMRNTATSESVEGVSIYSVVTVPGADWLDDRNDVPHGTVSVVYYYSTALGFERRMHVYTPPDYGAGNAKYPVFYLLHGGSDNDDAWISEGRANFILDNLIAAKKAVPMVVVMPSGDVPHPLGVRAAEDRSQRDEFSEDLFQDVMPYVQKNFRVLTECSHTAIAGLSMGGIYTINAFMAHPERFGYVGVWSAGVFEGTRRTGSGAASDPAVPVAVAPEWVQAHASVLDNAKVKKGLKLLWFGTGKADSLMGVTKATVTMFKEHGFTPVLMESEGGHVWSNWRDYLNQFAPQLFR